MDTGILFYFIFPFPPGLLRCSVTQPPALLHGLEKHFLMRLVQKKPVTELQDPHQRLSAIEESSGSDRERRQ